VFLAAHEQRSFICAKCRASSRQEYVCFWRSHLGLHELPPPWIDPDTTTAVPSRFLTMRSRENASPPKSG